MTEPAITADVLDLAIRDADRVAGSVAALVCNTAGRVVQPVVVQLPAGGVGAGGHRRFFDVICTGMAAAAGDGEPGGILVAVARGRGPFVTGDDREWHDAARRSCADHGVQLLGTWLVTRNVVRRVDDADPQDRSA